MEYQNAREYHAGLLREADQRRLAHQRPEQPATGFKGLNQLGTRLLALGAFLRKRYDYARQAPAAASGHSD
jgi:hypothetical protein